MKKLLYLILILVTNAKAQNVFHVPYDSSYKVPCDSIYYTYDIVKVKTDSVLKKTIWCEIGLTPCKWGYQYARRIDTILHTITSRCDMTSTFYRDSLGRKIVAGVMINQDGSVLYDKGAAAKDSLHVDYVREGIDFSNWKGKSNDLDDYRAKGLKVYLNVTYSTCNTKPCPYPNASQLPIIVTNLEDCITSYKDVIAALVAPNEPFNQNYYSTTDRTDYNNLLIAVSALGKKYNIPVYDGGLYATTLEILTYRWLKRTGQAAALDSFKICMGKSEIKEADFPGSNTKLQQQVIGDSLTMITDKVYGQGVNIHQYYDSAKVEQHIPNVRASLTYIQRYVNAITGLPLISNETGVRNCINGVSDPNTPPNAVTALMQIFKDLEIDVFFFSGNHGAACSQGLFTDDGKLKDAGKAFKNFIDNK